MLKYQIDSLDGLDDSVKAMYTEKNGKFVLGIEGLPDTSEYEQRIGQMDSKINELLDEKKKSQQKAKDAEEAARKAAEEAARKSGDVESLEKSLNESWGEKFGKLETESKTKIETMTGTINRLLVDSVAQKIASEIAIDGSADILVPHIKQRLAAVEREGDYKTAILTKDGKPSALNFDDLKTEFASNPAFKPVIASGKANGGGAGGGNGGGAADKRISRNDFNQLPPNEQAKFCTGGGEIFD
ncbi:MAG: hypothetical protein GY862_26925 [Gammaproteobacteria bacterium]|nr:hypothetical protein [Gammaproteobacteria bacterium]MCP5013827.1 hypothetical protein [Ketobacter sp.]